MTNQEKILIFRTLLVMLAIGKMLIKKFVVDEYILNQVSNRTDYLCKDLSDHINYLRSLD